MRKRLIPLSLFALAASVAAATGQQQTTRPYRLGDVDLKERTIWGAECREPQGSGLAFGGQDQDADDGRPHTRVLEDGKWKAIHGELRAKNSLQPFHEQAWAIRNEVKNLRARTRRLYFQGLVPAEEAALVKKDLVPLCEEVSRGLATLVKELGQIRGAEYESQQIRFALDHIDRAGIRISPFSAVTAETIKTLRQAQIHLEIAAEALDAEPPPRALNCGMPRQGGITAPAVQGIVYDAKTGQYVVFGGDHLDYLTNDTWVFDPAARRWFQQHGDGAPPPRANHRLEAAGNGKVRMTGGYTYASNTDYCGGQYSDRDDGSWVYDIEKDVWAGGTLVPADSRVYRTGPFHPDYYLQGEKPSAAKFQARLAELPVNEWVATDPPYRPRLNRDWGTARIDPDHDVMLRWSGGHSAHGGTDVPHYHFATNRWELPFAVEFPLGQLYANTRYPQGFNFNLRPWMTGHTYQNYAYDPPSRQMVKAGRPRHYHLYDPLVADWVGRGRKPPAMQYNSCFYTLTLVATPHGAVCWDKNGAVHLFDSAAAQWQKLEPAGDKLPGAVVDNSTIAYDSQRDRVLTFCKPYGQAAYDGQVYAFDMKSRAVKALSPQGADAAAKFAYIDRCCYDAAGDVVLMATYLNDGGEHTPTPAYDCAKNRWIMLDIEYQVDQRHGRPQRLFPHGRSCGIMYDPRRRLIWGTDTNSQVYVLQLEHDLAATSEQVDRDERERAAGKSN